MEHSGRLSVIVACLCMAAAGGARAQGADSLPADSVEVEGSPATPLETALAGVKIKSSVEDAFGDDDSQVTFSLSTAFLY